MGAWFYSWLLAVAAFTVSQVAYFETQAALSVVRDTLTATEKRATEAEGVIGAELPCPAATTISCPVVYQDGQLPRFRYQVEDTDLGVLRCYNAGGVEVLP